MGSISELGPIDLQIGGVSSLSLGEALEYIARVVEKSPKSADMFSQFLIKHLPLEKLGHTKMISESINGYAERLLKGTKSAKEAKVISTRTMVL